MPNLERRLYKLEGAKVNQSGTFTCVTLDGTRDEVEAHLTDLRAAGGSFIARITVPFIGESINDYRRAAGLEPLAVEGWDEPHMKESET